MVLELKHYDLTRRSQQSFTIPQDFGFSITLWKCQMKTDSSYIFGFIHNISVNFYESRNEFKKFHWTKYDKMLRTDLQQLSRDNIWYYSIRSIENISSISNIIIKGFFSQYNRYLIRCTKTKLFNYCFLSNILA